MNNGKEKLITRNFLCFYIANKEQKKIDEKLINKLIINYNSLKDILEIKKLGIIEFLYFNRKYIHKILLNDNEIITIKNNYYENNLSSNFYLSLLIEEDLNTINYQYSIEYIQELYNKYKKIKGKFKALIICKIIKLLIQNYKQTDIYDNDKEENELSKIEEQNEKIIQDNSNKIENIITKKIDEIYIEILINLINNKKFEDYDYSYNIINQIDLENIELTPLMYDKLYEIYNCKKKYIKDYLIIEEEDLNDEKKILFYYFSLKFIFKNPLYIFQIPFLFKTRNNILKMLNSNKIIYNKINQNIKDRFEFILEKLIDSKYYFQEINEKDLIKLKEVLNYYREFLFESKKEDILSIENCITNKKGLYKKFLKDYDISIKINKRSSIINYFLERKNKNDNNFIKEEEKAEYIKIWNDYEKFIKNKEFNKINENDKFILLDYFNNDKNKNNLMKIFKHEEYEFCFNELNKQIDEVISTKNKSKISQKNSSIVKEDISIKDNSNKEEEYRLSRLINSGIQNNLEVPNDYSVHLNFSEKEMITFDVLATYIKDILKKYEHIIKLEKGNIIIDENNNYNYILKTLEENPNIEKFNYQKYTILNSNFDQLKNFIKYIEKNIKSNFGLETLEIHLIFQENIFEENSNSKYKNINCEYEIKKEMPSIIGEKLVDFDVLNEFNDEKKFNNFNKFLDLLKNNNSKNTINLSDAKANRPINLFSSINSQIINKVLIGEHKKGANYIIELENGYLISGGPESIILYDLDYSIKKVIKKEHNSICPVKNEKGNIDLVISRDEGLYASSINNNNIEEYFRRIKCDTNSNFCFNLNKNYLVCNNEGFFQYNDILGKIIEIKGNLIIKKKFFGGIIINDYIIALTSNKETKKGEDEIIFYNNNSKKIFKVLKEYSFTKSLNNLTLISTNKKDNNKLLLCACTKYNKNQINGILLIKIQFDGEEEKFLKFFKETGNFEVHCFCQIFYFKNDNYLLDAKKKNKHIHSEYFLVGGYDNEKKEGLIKLYKINYNEENFDKIKIEEIEIGNENKKLINESNNFKKPINCMIQSQLTGKIILTCMDGYVYLFSYPNISDLKDKKNE